MSDSDKLRETISDNKIDNLKSKKVEKEVVLATKQAIEKIKKSYTNYKIVWEKELKKNDIHFKLKDQFLDQNIGTNLTVNSSGIKPDGGFLFVISSKGKRLLLGAVEAKKQGTNDLREEEGKSKQARGNAIERSCKNYIEISNFLLDEEIYPYLIFMKGCDVEDLHSSIRDRITNMNLGSPFNNLYVDKLSDKYGRLHSRASIFIGINADIMSETIFKMFDTSMKYYINKYPDEF